MDAMRVSKKGSVAAKLGATFAALLGAIFRRGPVGYHGRLIGLGEAAVITYWPPRRRENGIVSNRYRQKRAIVVHEQKALPDNDFGVRCPRLSVHVHGQDCAQWPVFRAVKRCEEGSYG
jgi:hypothetical protein